MNESLVIKLTVAALAGLNVAVDAQIATAVEPGQFSTDSSHNEAVKILRDALEEQTFFVKVHAAEALLGLGYHERVLTVFEEELKQHADEPHYRIGIWRVLARAEREQVNREPYFSKLCDVCLASSSPDRVDAAESLAKLGLAIPRENRQQLLNLAQNAATPGVPHYRWLLAVSGVHQDVQFLADLLDNPNSEVRGIAAYALRHLAENISPDMKAKIAKAAFAEPESGHRVYMISAAYILACDDDQAKPFKDLLLPYAKKGNKDDKYEVAAALALRGNKNDLALLAGLLKDSNADVRVSAANAVLRMDRRHAPPRD
jgi:SSS family solute:Na+ symporter